MYLVDLEPEQRQALGSAHSVCTDCVSMVTMRQQGITDVLTRDVHFAQERFIMLP